MCRKGGDCPVVDRTMGEVMPVRLKREPLIESLWEIRFQSEKPSVFELLLGTIYKSLSDKYSNIVRLPAADIPRPVKEIEASLRYVPRIRLEGGNHSVQIGERSVSLSCQRPYSGWERFSEEIRNLVEVLRGANSMSQLERFSLKYVDLIELQQPPDLSCLNVELKLGGVCINTKPVQLRSEIKDHDLIHIMQILSPAQVLLPDEQKLSGVLLDIDTIRRFENDESWDVLISCLDDAHSASKRMFFKLLTHETIERLEPEYEG